MLRILFMKLTGHQNILHSVYILAKFDPYSTLRQLNWNMNTVLPNNAMIDISQTFKNSYPRKSLNKWLVVTSSTYLKMDFAKNVGSRKSST